MSLSRSRGYPGTGFSATSRQPQCACLPVERGQISKEKQFMLINIKMSSKYGLMCDLPEKFANHVLFFLIE